MKFAIKFANTVFVLGILYSILVAVYAVYKVYNIPESVISTRYYSFLLLAFLAASLLWLGLKMLRDEFKVNMSVLFITTVISVYGFEIYLEFFHEIPQATRPQPLKGTRHWLKKMKIPFDARTPIEVIEDLNDSGVKAYPNVFPYLFVGTNGLSTSNGRIYPLGGISNITTILRPESGFFPIIETDEHGFNNPKELYEINNVDIVLTGDSFTEGFSVQSDESIGALLRESGFNVISLGKASNGPLIEFAAVKEYAKPLKPKIVLWLFSENDLLNLNSEMESSLLKKYLIEEKFTQNLLSRQEEIYNVLMRYLEELESKKEKEKEKEKGKERIRKRKREREREIEGVREWWVYNKLVQIARLNTLRGKINLFLHQRQRDLIFKEILQKSKQMIHGWGGKMYFVYLPLFDRYSNGKYWEQVSGIEEKNREFVITTVDKLEIPIIDIHKEVFVLHPDPLSLFPFRTNNHYTAEGYKLVGDAISKRLKADGIISLNSKN